MDLSEVLESLSLSHVEAALTELGVTDADDVLALEADDLKAAGLNMVQIRKLQNALKGKPAASASPAAHHSNGNGSAEEPLMYDGHELTKGKTEHDRYCCDLCSKPIPKGAPVYSCREINFDICSACARQSGGGNGASVSNGKSCKWCELGECWTPNCGGKKGGGNNGGGIVKKKAVVLKKPTGPFKRKFLEFSEGDFDMDDAVAKRQELELVIDGGPAGTDNYHPPITSFEEITALPAHCIEALNENGITTPMPIQAQAIPIVLAGDDFVGVAKTGSGKTLAYLIPAVVHIEAQDPISDTDLSPIAVILAPTRELAVQIHEEAEKLCSKSEGAEGSVHEDGIKACCIYGGTQKGGQLRLAMGAHILAATPGRLHDHVMKGDISMHRVTYFVLDEGDRMLEEGFESQVKTIANAIRDDRHMLFFSATWPTTVHKLAKAMCKGKKPPVRLRVGQNSDGTAKTRDDIVQEVHVFDEGSWDERDKKKKEMVYEHIRAALNMPETKVLTFVSRKDLAEEVSYAFNQEGFESEAMHGGKGQDQRLQVLERFKNGDTRLLVATDVMGRGLDIPTITHVVVYDMGDIEDYVHRIGRTARGPHGDGHALTLFEYDARWPHLAEGLIKVLEASNQNVPFELTQIAEQVNSGERAMQKMKGRWGKLSGNQGSYEDIAKKTYGDVGAALAKW